MNTRIPIVLAAVLALGACASTPKPLQGNFAPISPLDSVTSAEVGTTVRWGGRIVETSPMQDQTCFQIISAPLGSSGRPNNTNSDATSGRFIACRAGFYDPETFTSERDVTLIGKIEGYETIPIGEYEYRLPHVEADVIYLWPKVTQVPVMAAPYAYPYYDPFWGPWWGPRWWW
ncbi:MAG: Slp family lipoprotein [Xanthomonadaceae bacterium]|jgi:outer membrane lipoprotein|nr:Slp family lipoprotein [Xanthomonadaceae bacterium]